MVQTYFHLYGFILGCAMVLGIYLSEKKAEKYGFSKEIFWRILTVGLVSGWIGSRLWHVMTDFSLYTGNLMSIFYIWNGGLSIIGGLIGGAVGVCVFAYFSKKITWREILVFLDLVIFGLPFAQALGRVGNWINYELYGLPTGLPWAIFIPPSFRKPGFESFSYFHPLFAYEAVLLFLFGCVIWWLDRTRKNWLAIGSNRLLFLYLVYYAGIRFFLDFLRIDRIVLGEVPLGFNQVILIFIGIVSSFLLYRNIQTKK